jgi:putative peptide maturation system protein
MNITVEQTLVDTLEYLMSLTQEGTRPEEAKVRLRHLQKQHPDTKMDLLWEEEAYDYSVHYDALLHLQEQGTISLSFCPDRALPWPLRGVHRWSERDVVRVNTTLLQVGEVIACLDFIWDEVPIVKRLIDMCLIREVLEEDPIELSDAELQVAMNNFRKARKLYKAEDTYRWLEQHGMTHEKVESLVANEAVVVKLRDRLTAVQVPDYFEAHRSDFDKVHIAQIQFSDEESAYQTWEQICSGRVDFYEVAQQRFLEAVERREHPSGEVFAVLQRQEIEPELEVIFAAHGDVLQPVQTDKGYAIARVLAFTPARLDERTITAIKKILFEEWLIEKRQTARIEWYWGNAVQTDSLELGGKAMSVHQEKSM